MCLEIVAVGVSADRDPPLDLGTPIRSSAHGQHGGRPLQKRWHAQYILFFRETMAESAALCRVKGLDDRNPILAGMYLSMTD